MASFKAIIVMLIWTAITFYGLYTLGAHELAMHNFVYALATGVALLVIHMVNMALYFKIAGEKPFEWFKS
jgi:hypothetical protein